MNAGLDLDPSGFRNYAVELHPEEGVYACMHKDEEDFVREKCMGILLIIFTQM
jgi:hypothetical protein